MSRKGIYLVESGSDDGAVEARWLLNLSSFLGCLPPIDSLRFSEHREELLKSWKLW